MRTISIPEDTPCSRCRQPATIVDHGLLYCGDNCAAHTAAMAIAGRLVRLVDSAQGGSPDALALIDDLNIAVNKLVPIRPHSACPRCWGFMHGGVAMPPAPDGSQVMGERCGTCNYGRPVAEKDD